MNKVIVALMLIVSSCAVNKTLHPTGGSKADGTIEMSYTYGGFERPIVNFKLAEDTAGKKCKAWGYKSAEAFGGAIKECGSYYNGSCNSYIVKKEYQCID